MLEPVQEDPESAFLRVALVGPSHLRDSESRRHTTALAHSLERAGHQVTLVSWSYRPPGRTSGSVAEGPSSEERLPRMVDPLCWGRPDNWLRAGRRLRGFDLIVLVQDTPAVAAAYLTVLRAARARPGTAGRGAPRSVFVCLAPPIARVVGRTMWRPVVAEADAVLVHSAADADAVRALGARRVSCVALPPLSEGTASPQAHGGPARLLALESSRSDEGLGALLEALREVPDLRLTIAGLMGGEHGQRIRHLAADPMLAERVVIRDEQLPAEALAALAAEHDVLTLPRIRVGAPDPAADVVLGQVAGMAVLTSDVDLFGPKEPGWPGAAASQESDKSLAGALRRLLDPSVLAQLRAGAEPSDLSGPWAAYVGTLESLAAPDVSDLDVTGSATTSRRPQHARSLALTRGRALSGRAVAGVITGRALLARRSVLELSRHDLPDWVRPTDVLEDDQVAAEARAAARELGLPRTGDATASWAALGALAAIVRVSDDGRHSSVIVDESGPRSPMTRWARRLGFAPVALGLTRSPSTTALEVDSGGLDVVTRLHPGGCDAFDVDETIAEASWALRPGGLLTLTLPLGPATMHGAVSPADVRGVVARAHGYGFVLVGDLDGDILARMMSASSTPSGRDTAYGLVLLTFRRQRA